MRVASMEGQGRGRPRTGGVRQNRTEMMSVRLTPRMRYLVELAARHEGRAATSFVERLIEKGLGEVQIREGNVDVLQLSFVLWHPFEPDRFVRLALRFPELLTHEEQVLWTY